MKIIISLLIFISCNASAYFEKTQFDLIFKVQKPMEFEVSLYELDPMLYASKVGTNGDLLDLKQLNHKSQIKNMSVSIASESDIFLGLVVKNKSPKDTDFFVAPHHTNPSHSTLDFKFDCLCYHHIYHVKANGMWYRILRLVNTKKESKNKKIELSHTMIPFVGKKPAQNH